MSYITAILLDSGDTLVDEGSEIKDSNGVTLKANLILGAKELVHGIKERGYKLGLVADGPIGTFKNILGFYHLFDLFDVHAVSGIVGVEKPDPIIFRFALDSLKIPQQDYCRVVMLGNNLERDVLGANRLGLISVWINWSPRYSKIPSFTLEVPKYTVKKPDDLLKIIDQVEEDNTL